MDWLTRTAGAAKTRMQALPMIAALAAFALCGAMIPARAQEPIRIGFSVSLTGGLASSGKANLLAQQIWAEEINATGGLLGRPIKFVYYDAWAKPQLLMVQFQNVQGSGLDQYKTPGKQVILYPPEYQDGQLENPFAK